MTRTIQAWFPTFAGLLTSAAPEANVRMAIEQTAETSGYLLDCRDRKYRFRVHGRAFPGWTFPSISIRIASSAGGVNVYVRTPDSAAWSVLHLTLLVTTVCGWFVSWSWGELVFAPWIALMALMASMGHVWHTGQRVLGVLEGYLEAHG